MQPILTEIDEIRGNLREYDRNFEIFEILKKNN